MTALGPEACKQQLLEILTLQLVPTLDPEVSKKISTFDYLDPEALCISYNGSPSL